MKKYGLEFGSKCKLFLTFPLHFIVCIPPKNSRELHSFYLRPFLDIFSVSILGLFFGIGSEKIQKVVSVLFESANFFGKMWERLGFKYLMTIFLNLRVFCNLFIKIVVFCRIFCIFSLFSVLMSKTIKKW